jgi:hypothetical protein
MKHDALIEELAKSTLYRVDFDGSIWSCLPANGRGRLPDGVWRRAEYFRCVNTKKPTDGYLFVHFKGQSIRSHRVVYRMLIGPLDPALQINHKNGNKLDNRPENLELVTQSENLKHAYKHGLNPGSGRGSKNTNAKLTEDQVREIHRLRAAGVRPSVIGRQFGLNPARISIICAGREWPHVAAEFLH